MARKLRYRKLRHDPKYPDITADVVEAEQSAKPQLSPHDRRELARYVRKYGREAVIAAAETISLPGKRGRPPRDRIATEVPTDIAEFIYSYANKHRTARSKKPIEDAMRDLYDVLVDADTQREPGHFERWSRTIKRKRSPVRREVEARLDWAEKTAEWFHKKRSANKSRD